MSFGDNKIFWTSFISLYRENPCLWKIKSKEYSNKPMKNAAYQKLVEKCKEINADADLKYVRKKIDSLRAGFRREMKEKQKSKKTGTGTDDMYEPILWYFEELLFLKDQEESRRGTSSTNDQQSGSEEEDNLEDNELKVSLITYLYFI